MLLLSTLIKAHHWPWLSCEHSKALRFVAFVVLMEYVLDKTTQWDPLCILDIRLCCLNDIRKYFLIDPKIQELELFFCFKNSEFKNRTTATNLAYLQSNPTGFLSIAIRNLYMSNSSSLNEEIIRKDPGKFKSQHNLWSVDVDEIIFNVISSNKNDNLKKKYFIL